MPFTDPDPELRAISPPRPTAPPPPPAAPPSQAGPRGGQEPTSPHVPPTQTVAQHPRQPVAVFRQPLADVFERIDDEISAFGPPSAAGGTSLFGLLRHQQAPQHPDAIGSAALRARPDLATRRLPAAEQLAARTFDRAVASTADSRVAQSLVERSSLLKMRPRTHQPPLKTTPSSGRTTAAASSPVQSQPGPRRTAVQPQTKSNQGRNERQQVERQPKHPKQRSGIDVSVGSSKVHEIGEYKGSGWKVNVKAEASALIIGHVGGDGHVAVHFDGLKSSAISFGDGNFTLTDTRLWSRKRADDFHDPHKLSEDAKTKGTRITRHEHSLDVDIPIRNHTVDIKVGGKTHHVTAKDSKLEITLKQENGKVVIEGTLSAEARFKGTTIEYGVGVLAEVTPDFKVPRPDWKKIIEVGVELALAALGLRAFLKGTDLGPLPGPVTA